MWTADLLASINTARFRREARRIRAAAVGDPAKTHQKLRELIDRQKNEPVEGFFQAPTTQLAPIQDWSKSAVLGQRGAAARLFADMVASRLLGPILPFDQRVALLREANDHDIGRFEANLIIAAVQNQIYGKRAMARRDAKPAQSRRVQSRFSLSHGIAAAVAVQSAILLVAWFLMH